MHWTVLCLRYGLGVCLRPHWDTSSFNARLRFAGFRLVPRCDAISGTIFLVDTLLYCVWARLFLSGDTADGRSTGASE